MNHTHISIRIFVKILLTVAVLIASASGVPALAADSATMRVKNITHPAYSLAETYNEAAGSEPGDIMNFRMIYSSATPATSMEVVLPDNLSFADAVSVVAGTAAAAQVSGQTIVFSFTASTFQIITFNATVASGSNFTGTDHSIEMSFSTNGTPTASDTATITVGPIVTGITPSTGNNSGGIVITEIMGHGLAGATSAVLSLDGTTAIHTFDISGATITDTSITDAGSAIRVPASFTPGEYWVMVTITSSGNELVTNADTTETVKYTATDGIAPVMQTGSNSYIHSSGILALSFNETIDVSATDATKITLADALTGGNSLTLNASTAVSTTDSTAVTFTLVQDDRNTISTWGQAADTLYVHINGSGIFDLSANPLSNQGSRTALDTWTEDTTAPTASIVYTQNSTTVTSAKAGSLTVTVTFSEPLATTPQIAINQAGSNDVSATDMSGSSTTWTYAYTVSADDGGAGVDADGQASVTISNANDYAANLFVDPGTNAFTIDTIAPAPAITSLAGSPTSQTRITYNWTPSYTAADFLGYEFYYRTQAGVTSLNGTKISSQTSGYNSLSASGTNSLVLDDLTAGTPYYGVVYICDAAGNCSLASNEVQTTTQQNAVVSGGGGGGGSPSATPTYQTYDPTTNTLTTGEEPAATEPAPAEETQSPAEEPVATVSPEQESPNQQVLGAREYAEGTLVRTADKKIYVSENGVLRHIASLEELRASYAGRPIADISASVAAYKEGDLIRASDRKIYVIANGAKRHITSLRELAANHFGKPIHDVSLAILLQY